MNPYLSLVAALTAFIPLSLVMWHVIHRNYKESCKKADKAEAEAEAKAKRPPSAA